MSKKKALAALILFLAPVALVFGFKKSAYGPLLATPKARQFGDSRAPVTVVEYSDFQCPSCARLHPVVKEFLKTYEGKIKLYFKYYPLTSIHKNALPAAHAAECAAEQNQFWPYGSALFERQMQWAPLADATTHYMAIAQETHLDMPRFEACYKDPVREQRVMADAKEAEQRGVNATPTFFVDDERLVGNVFAADGARAIERALRRQ